MPASVSVTGSARFGHCADTTPQSMISHTQALFSKIAAWATVALGFCLPISTAASNGLLLLCLLAWLGAGQWSLRWQTFISHPVAHAACLLWGLMALSLLYTQATYLDAWQMLFSYKELLYIPVFAWVFRDPLWQRRGLDALLLALLLTLVLSYVNAFSDLQIGTGTLDNPVVFKKSYITQGVLLTILAMLLLWYRIQYPNWRWFIAGLIIFSLYNVLFLNQGRSAYLMVFALLLWLGFLYLNWRGLLLGVLMTGLLISSAYYVSDSTQQRLTAAWENVSSYRLSQPANSSVGYRLEFYYHSVLLIKLHPWLGTGAGGFSQAYKNNTANQGLIASGNPHNDFLMIAVQWGLLGLAAFLWWLSLLWSRSRFLGDFQQPAQGLLLIMCVGGLFNSFWLDFTEGHVFAYLIGLFYARVGLESPACPPGTPAVSPHPI